MSLLPLKKHTRFVMNGRSGVISGVEADFVVLNFDGLGKKLYEPHEIKIAYTEGDFFIENKKPDFFVEKITDPIERDRYNFVQCVVTHMHESGVPKSPTVIESALKLAISRVGKVEGKSFSITTAKRWYDKWAENGQSISAVVGKTKAHRRSKFDEQSRRVADDIIQREYLRLHGCSVDAAFRLYKEEFEMRYPNWKQVNASHSNNQGNLKPMGRSSFRNYVNSYDAYEVDKARMGVKAARNKHRAVTSSVITSRPLERVEVDAVHPNLALVIEDKEGGETYLRPILYVAIDVYTRLVVGYVVSYGAKNASEEACAVVELIKQICNPMKVSRHSKFAFPLGGKPEAIVSDSGTAFNAFGPAGMMLDFGISHHVTEKASPWKKPFIERFFGTLRSQLFQSIDGYAPARSRGMELDNTLEYMAHLSCTEFEELFENYILNIYHNNRHGGLGGQTPLEVWENIKGRCLPCLPCDFKEVSKYKGQRMMRKISFPKGIQINYAYYSSRELIKLGHQLERQARGDRKVTVMYDPNDIQAITVLNPLTGELFEVPTTSKSIYPGLYESQLNHNRNACGGNQNAARSHTMKRVSNNKKAKPKIRKDSGDAHDISVKLSPEQHNKIMQNGLGKHDILRKSSESRNPAKNDEIGPQGDGDYEQSEIR